MRIVLFTLLFPVGAIAQPLVPMLLSTLDPVLNETSGLMHVNGELWTILDSGNPNKVYRVEPATGAILREVVLAGATNVDWEAIETDGTWVYVGDIGNNGGARTDLRIHRFPLNALLDQGNDTIEVEHIDLAYADQVDFSVAYDGTNWDCEAFIPMDDSLFLFTKNWLDGRTLVYAVPAWPGDHLAVKVDSFNVQGLVTGATRDAGTGALSLVGYTSDAGVPFIWVFNGYTGHDFFGGTAVRRELDMVLLQTEGITWTQEGDLFISNERSPLIAARLWAVAWPNSVPVERSAALNIRLWPTPSALEIHVTGADPESTVRVMEINGRTVAVLQLDANERASLPVLSPGRYFAEVRVKGAMHRLPMLIAH